MATAGTIASPDNVQRGDRFTYNPAIYSTSQQGDYLVFEVMQHYMTVESGKGRCITKPYEHFVHTGVNDGERCYFERHV